MTVREFFGKNKTLLLVLLPPLVLLPLPVISKSQESKCAYGLLLMAFYWTTEAFPVSITALLPVVLFPLMGVVPIGSLSSKYFNPITFVLLGGLAVAISIEKWNVHKRIALRLLLIMGTTPKWLMLGFMLTTSFLSMWVSNTATTSMMIPIAQAVLLELMAMRMSRQRALHDKSERNGGNITCPDEKANKDQENVDVDIEMEDQGEGDKLVTHPVDEFDFDALDPESQKMCKAMLLSICYAANCGGVATLTGTGPNLVMKGQADIISDGKAGITFATWFIFSFPVALINVLFAWLCIQVVSFGVRPLFKSGDKAEGEAVKSIIRSQYRALGKISFAEKGILANFLILVIAWFTLEPEFVPGWSVLFKHGYVNDAVPAMLIGCILFVFPSSRDRDNVKDPNNRTLLDWKTFNRKFPWTVTLLLGGGFSLAHACKESGLSLWIAHQMSVLTDIPSWAMILIISLIVSLSTEVTTNTAVCTIFMPILADLAKGIHVHPIYIMLPAAISSSFAFMLPVATPPNTIAFSYGYLKIVDMIKVGWILNLFCVVVVTMAINTWGMAYFHLDVYPDWAKIPEVIQTSLYNGTEVNTSNLTFSMTSPVAVMDNTTYS